MKLILLSSCLLTVGMILAFMMVIHLLAPSFVLGFLAYAASLSGLTLGVSATVQHGIFRGKD
jgi:hypothetical protein